MAGTISQRNASIKSYKAIFNVLTLPIKLRCELATAKFIRRKIVGLNDIFMSHWFKEVVDKIANIEEAIVRQIRLQISLENIFQLTGNIILIFYSISLTKTRQSLVTLFQENEIIVFGWSIPSIFVIIVLTVMNLASFIKGNVHGIVNGHGCNYGLFGFCLVFTNIICASIVRILSIILYFAPSLGLFNLLHHYQGTVSIMYFSFVIYLGEPKTLHSYFSIQQTTEKN